MSAPDHGTGTCEIKCGLEVGCPFSTSHEAGMVIVYKGPPRLRRCGVAMALRGAVTRRCPPNRVAGGAS